MCLRSKICSLLLLSVLLGGCVTVYNPATGKNEAMFIDTPLEVSFGENMDKQIKKEMKLSNNPLMVSRLEKIGNAVAGVSDRKDITYRFRVIDDKQLNAFTIPGGYIYVNSGLMDAANDDELACVIAHELGHLAARHPAKKMQAALGYQVIVGIAAGFDAKDYMMQAMDAVFSISSLGYSRKDELAADKLSVKYSRRAGYSPYGMVTMFAKLEKEAKANGKNNYPEFLRSHPPTDARIKGIENEIKEE
ncbi:MAG: M48 family metallopeptidase [Candidatus Omnitrophica bacterium]|jgi:predicted Zn-dependent protease|nr:M48 family metallopeptidase [Candidatus Omnitrophota bacterium]